MRRACSANLWGSQYSRADVFAPRPQSAITKRAFVGESDGGGWGAEWKFNVVSTRDDKRRRRAQRQREGGRAGTLYMRLAQRRAYTYIHIFFPFSHQYSSISTHVGRFRTTESCERSGTSAWRPWFHSTCAPGWSRKMIGYDVGQRQIRGQRRRTHQNRLREWVFILVYARNGHSNSNRKFNLLGSFDLVARGRASLPPRERPTSVARFLGCGAAVRLPGSCCENLHFSAGERALSVCVCEGWKRTTSRGPRYGRESLPLCCIFAVLCSGGWEILLCMTFDICKKRHVDSKYFWDTILEERRNISVKPFA
jgi:hypothetical protein